MNVLQLKKEIDSNPQTVLLDVREKWEYEICHIENSINISMSEIMQRMDELEKQQKIVVICHHGMRSVLAAEYLVSEGFKQIVNLEGGIDAWSTSIDKSMTKY